MMVVPPTYVKRDGVQYRVDGVHHNCVFMFSQHQKCFVLDARLGTMFAKSYHPITLATFTKDPKLVINGVLGTDACADRYDFCAYELLSVEALKKAKTYSTNLSKLLNLDIPRSVLNLSLIPILGALVERISAKELHQGVKTLLGVDIPKVTVNYLSGGYLIEGGVTVENLLYMVRNDGRLPFYDWNWDGTSRSE